MERRNARRVLRWQRCVILGLPVDVVDFAQAIAIVDDAVASRRQLFVSTPNMSFFTNARKNLAFRESLFLSDLCLADGAPVIWLASLLGVSLPGRIAGSDLFDVLRRRTIAGPRGPLKVYFFGGAEGVAAAACRRVNENSSGIVCVGAAYPGYRSIEEMSDAETVSKINDSKADILVVAIGLVRGQEWIVKNRGRIDCPVVVYLGAVINFEAGMVSRAPTALSELGLEWLWRIKEEPKLATRYAADFSTLVRLFLCGVLPNILQTVRGRLGSQRSYSDCRVEIDKSGGRVQLTMSGDANASNSDRIRARFLEVYDSKKSVTLVANDLHSIDAVALGEIALLWKVLHESGRSLTVTGLQDYPLRFFQMSGLGSIVSR